MTDPDEIVAMLYQIGGRRAANTSRPLRRHELDPADTDTADPAEDTQAGARDAYPSRTAARAHRRWRGGGR
jgi:hypothetical protein